MFDLFRSQKQVVRFLLGGILVVVALSMVITLVPGLYSNAAQDTNNPILAEVDGTPVTIQDVQMRLRDYQSTGQIPPDSMVFLAAQTIENLITDQVLMEEARKLGLMPSEAELAERIRSQLKIVFDRGGFPAYQQFVQQQFQRSIPEFEQAVLRDLVIELRLKRLVTDGVLVSDEDLKRDFKLANDQVQIEYITVASEGFRPQVQPDEEKIKQFFEQNKSRYNTQETRSIKLMRIPSEVAAPAQVTDAEMQEFYNRNLDRYQVGERIRASHILFMTMDKSEEETKAIEAKAREVLEKIKGGADFGAMAKQYSEDPGNKDNGGDLGWVVRGQMVPDFEKASFALQPGQMSDLVKTEYGYHIVKVSDRDSAHVQTFDEVKDQIHQEISQERDQVQRVAQMDKAVAAAQQHGANLEDAGKELGLTVETYENFNRFQLPPGVPATPNFVSAVFGAKQGEVLSEVADNATVVMVVTAIDPAHAPALDEVREQVTRDWSTQQAGNLARDRAQEIADAAKANGNNLKEAAAKFNLTPKTSEFVNRAGSLKELGSAQILGDKAFTDPPGTIAGPVPGAGGQVVYKVIGRQDADMAAFETQREQLSRQQTQAKRDEAYEIFKGVTRARYENDGKITRYQGRIDTLVQALGRRS